MKKISKFGVISFSLLLSGFSFILLQKPANSGFTLPGTDTCVGFGCDGDPHVGGDWLKERWEEVGEAPASVSRICREVGAQRCSDPNFINTYQAIRALQISDNINTVDECGSVVYTTAELGANAGQIVNLYYGGSIPPPIINLGAESLQAHGIVSCGLLFEGEVNSANLVKIENEAIVTKEAYDKKYQEDKNSIPQAGQDSSPCVGVGCDGDTQANKQPTSAYYCSYASWRGNGIGVSKGSEQEACDTARNLLQQSTGFPIYTLSSYGDFAFDNHNQAVMRCVNGSSMNIDGFGEQVFNSAQGKSCVVEISK